MCSMMTTVFACLEVVGPGGQHEQPCANGAPQHDAVRARSMGEDTGEALVWQGYIRCTGPQDAQCQ